MRFLPAFLILCLLAFPASGQLFCDINGDSLFTGADVTRLAMMLNGYPESFNACGLNCDVDNDGESMTIADMATLTYLLRNPDSLPPYLSYNPLADTVRISSSQESPGGYLSLPIYLSTVDTLIAYEFLIKINPDYLTISDFIPGNDLEFNYPFSTSRLHIIQIGTWGYGEILYCFPGNYRLGDLVLHVNPDIIEPVTTYIEFVTCPEENFYTGMANITFFVPILVNGEVTITPTGIDDEYRNLPMTALIELYPNPFNGSVNLRVQSDESDRLIIYDILGREIRSFRVEAGFNNITWDAIDSRGKLVNTGVYFARLENKPGYSRKISLLK